jgi:protein SCO1/2
MKRKTIFYIVFFVVLLGCFYAGLSISMPGFGKPALPPISTVQPFAFTNQDGKTITEKEALGKVSVANFFFTTCTSVCPRMNGNLKPVYRKFSSQPDFIMLSYTCDPERDSAARLKRYADSFGVDTRKWMFLTGRKDSLYTLARHSYKIDDPKNFVADSNDDFMHTQFVALVNKKGEVVKVYDGLRPSEMKEMEGEIEKLLKE